MGIKSRQGLFFARLTIKILRLVNSCPRRLRIFGGPLLGGLIGLTGGIPGFFIGFLLGYLLRELFIQSFRDRRILDYFENPGVRQFYESEPGLAAWCALAVLVAAADATTNAGAGAENEDSSNERIMRQVLLGASRVFTDPLTDPFQIEHFSRLALSKRGLLNPDLLAESLAARRRSINQHGSLGLSAGSSQEDSGKLGRGLQNLAVQEKAKALAREIRLVLDPAWEDEQETESSGATDPWKILGLSPQTPAKEVKAHYRRLANQFHPDKLEVLDEDHREMAARAFMAIKEAYQKIAGSGN